MKKIAFINVLLIRSIKILLIIVLLYGGIANATQLKAGVARVNITKTKFADIANDSLYVKALVLEYRTIKAVIISIDAVAIGGIGSISDDYHCQ